MKRGLVVKCFGLFLLTLTGGGCKEKAAEICVDKVIDLTNEEELIREVRYDRDGHVVRYGDMPVVYTGERIVIGDDNALEAQDMFYSVTFKMGKGKAQESLARCLLAWKDSLYTVEKKSAYTYRGDTIVVRTDYRTIPERAFLQGVQKKYVFDRDGRLMEAWTSASEARDMVATYCASYRYDKNIVCEANLNLQAYVVADDGLDNFFYFLLNLGQVRNQASLPNEVSYSFRQGAERYKRHAHYRMDNEHPIRIEVLQDDTRLLSRYDFSYVSLH